MHVSTNTRPASFALATCKYAGMRVNLSFAHTCMFCTVLYWSAVARKSSACAAAPRQVALLLRPHFQ